MSRVRKWTQMQRAPVIAVMMGPQMLTGLAAWSTSEIELPGASRKIG